MKRPMPLYCSANLCPYSFFCIVTPSILNPSWFFLIVLHFCECVPLTISYHLYFLRASKIWSMLHHGSMGRVQNKECNSKSTYTFLGIFLLFFIKNVLFLSFPFLFMIKYLICATEY